MTKLRVIVAGLLLTLGVTLVPASTAVSADEGEMSVERAGDYYLKGACKQYAVGQEFNDKIWKGRKQISLKEVRRRLPQLKRLAAKYGRSSLEWSSHLYNPPKDWPDSVAGLANKLAGKNATFSSFRTAQGHADNAAEWAKYNGKANRVEFGALAVKIRARLSLPPSGEGC